MIRHVRRVCFVGLLSLIVVLPALAQDAGATFKSKCAMCHAPDGSGNSPAGKAMNVPDLKSEAVQKLSDAELTDVITKGKNKMPAYKDKLTAAEIKGLVGYVRGLAKK